jgi:hypothetical protein
MSAAGEDTAEDAGLTRGRAHAGPGSRGAGLTGAGLTGAGLTGAGLMRGLAKRGLGEEAADVVGGDAGAEELVGVDDAGE